MRALSLINEFYVHTNTHRLHGYRLWIALIAIVSITALFVSCEVSPTRPDSSAKIPVEFIDYVPMDKGGLQQISLHFGYEVVSLESDVNYLILYHLDEDSQKRQALAAIMIDGVVVNEYARKSLFAISWDEKTLLYMHEQAPKGPKDLRNKVSGLYEYVEGRGDHMIYSEAIIASHSSYQLARNAIEFALGGGRNDLAVEHYVRSTEGVEFIQEDAFAFQHGGTGLHRAAARGELARVRELLEYDLYIEARDNRQFTPLHSSVWAQQEAVAKLLIENGADIDTKTEDGSTVLHIFSSSVRDERSPSWNDSQAKALLLLLLERGSDVNAKDNNGATPLHYAVNKNNIRTAQILLENGADAEAMELADSHYYGNEFHHYGSELTLGQRINETLESGWWSQAATN